MKKFLCIALLCMFLLPSPVMAEEGTEQSDGYQVNTASQILRAASEFDSNEKELLDYTGNGTVNINDAKGVLLQNVGLADSREQVRSFLENSILDEGYIDLFCYNRVVEDGYDYCSGNVKITVTEHNIELEDRPVAYYVADIYVRNMNCFRTAFARSGRGKTDQVEDMARANSALIAVNGDFFSARGSGIITRNGKVYKKKVDKRRDLCILTSDGVMSTYLAKSYKKEDILAMDLYQSWNFGPALLDENSLPKTVFNSAVVKNNPRACIGYYEPGHYCFVVVDGRDRHHSYGLDMEHLSILMHDLGCTVAYNLDGGATAVLANSRGMINKRKSEDRECSDIIYIVDRDAETFAVAQTVVEDTSGESNERDP